MRTVFNFQKTLLDRAEALLKSTTNVLLQVALLYRLSLKLQVLRVYEKDYPKAVSKNFRPGRARRPGKVCIIG